MDKKIVKDSRVNVEMLIDQYSPEFGEKEKGEKFMFDAGKAKIYITRGILKLVKGAKNDDR